MGRIEDAATPEMAHYCFIDGDGICSAAMPKGMDGDTIEPSALAPAAHALLTEVSRLMVQDRRRLHVVLWSSSASLQQRCDAERDRRSPDSLTGGVKKKLQGLLQAAPVVQLWHPELEAKDLACLGSRLCAEGGYSVELLTPSPLWQQLVDERVTWVGYGSARKRKTAEDFQPDGALRNTVEVACLSGWPNENVPGIAGINATRAAQLLRQAGGLDSLLAMARSFSGLHGYPRWAQALSLPDNLEALECNRQRLEFKRRAPADLSRLQALEGAYDFLTALDAVTEFGLDELARDFPNKVRGITVGVNLSSWRTLQRLIPLQG